MLLCSPTFVDRTGYFPTQSLETSFISFNKGLHFLRGWLGEQLFEELMRMSDQIRALFEADPETKTGETRRGKDLVLAMEEMVEARIRRLQARGCNVTDRD
jgi:hypothetical protein